jgi:hypothetical protein
MTFDLIPPESLHAYWAYVREGLLKVKENVKEVWLPEDVYTSIRNKRSTLYVAREDERVLGFFICEASVEPFSHKPLLFVWCLSGPDGLPYADACIEFLDKLARSINAGKIKFIGRKGWARVLKGKFEDVSSVYERQVLP